MPEPVEAAKGAAGGVGNVLTRKVGPLPVWGYAVALGGGLLALRLIHPGTSSAGGVSASPVPVAAASAPAGTGADLVAPADTGPRQAPPVQDQGGTIPIPISTSVGAVVLPTVSNAAPGWYPIPSDRTKLGFFSPTSPGTPFTLPGVRDLMPTAPVQPPLATPSGGFPTGAVLQTIGGTNYSLSNDAVARGGVTDFGRPVASSITSPGGPTVSPGSQYGGPGSGPARTDVVGVAPASAALGGRERGQDTSV